MNVKNNKRRRESIEKIEKVFIELLVKKELHEITVSDICKIAELNRSTFYANFADVYELADKVKNHIEEDFGNLYTEEPGCGASDCVKMFQHIYDNQLLYKMYFKLGYDNAHEVYLYDGSQAEKYFDDKHIRHIEYHIEFFRNGLNAIIKKWLSGGCKESPEEMAEIVISEYQGRV